MKKILIISLLLFSCALAAFVSCKKNRGVEEFSNSTEQMLAELDSYNSNIFEKRKMDRLYDYHTNLFSQEITKADGKVIVGVAFADGKFGWKGWKYGSKAGAIAGPHSAVVVGSLSALLAGMVASLVAYDNLNGGELSSNVLPSLTPHDLIAVRDVCKEEKRSSRIEKQVEDVKKTINMPEEFSYTLEIGEMHNAMAEMIMDESFAIPQIIKKTSVEEENYISSPQFISLFNEAKTQADCSLDCIDGIDSVLLEQVINMFCEAYSTCYESVPDVDDIINNYINTIEGHNALTYEEKQTVYAGLSVIAFSSRYWYSND